jgi:peptidyl-dipeptidase Dcp
MPNEVAMRHRLPQFSHIFSGEGYASKYYSYLWADALTADAWGAFLEGEGPFDAGIASSFFENVLAVGEFDRPSRRLPEVPRARRKHRRASA